MNSPLVGFRRIAFAAAFIFLAVSMVSCGPDTSGLPDGLYALITTDSGEILIQLEPDRAPLTTMNFVGLAEGTITSNAEGRPFYDGLTFHRVEPGFVIQGGDPRGNGTGGPGYQFPTETHPDLLHTAEGTVAMANSGPDTNGSQFYITLSATPHLDGSYNVFGRVIRGMDAVSSIVAGDAMKKVEILRVGDLAKAYKPSDEQFRALSDRVLQSRAAAAAAQLREAEQMIERKWPNARLVEGSKLRMVDTVEGFGNRPAAGDTLSVHFTFGLIDGTQLDDTRMRGNPYVFVFGEERLIPGLDTAISLIREGGSAVAIIPPELAFGATGVPPAVPPNSYVVFSIDLVNID